MNKEEAIYNLRQAENLIQKSIFLVEDEPKLEEVERELERIKRRLVNLIFDIEEVKI